MFTEAARHLAHLPLHPFGDGRRFNLLGRLGQDARDIARLHFPTRDVAVVNSPATLHEVLVSKARAFDKSPIQQTAMYPLLGEGLFNSTGGEPWRRQRRLMAPVFQQSRIGAFAPTMVECTRQAIARWRQGARLDLARETTRIAMSVAGRTLFGVDTFENADEIGRALTVALEWVDYAVTAPAIMLQAELRLALLPPPKAAGAIARLRERWAARLERPIRWPTRLARQLGPALAVLDDFVARMIRERRAAPGARTDLLSALLQARDEIDGGRMSDKQVRDEILSLFLAGYETTANALAWSMYLLLRHPAAYARARDAALALGGRSPTLADAGQLEYLGRVFKEALRLYPPVYVYGRIANSDVELGGHPLPNRAIVLVSPYSVQRRADLWPEPERFDPERFTAAAEAARPREAWIPFSSGPRVCIGAYFAQLEALVVMAMFLQHADFTLCADREIALGESVTLRPSGGVPVRVHLRGCPVHSRP